jgi:predicted protein tyrosine phosphatase
LVTSKPSKRILFICSRNRLRSPTAEALFSGRDGIEALLAGTSPDAELRVDADLIEWADLIVAMERSHSRKLVRDFPRLMRGKEIVVLQIPDDYRYMQTELVALLERRMEPYL